jgi:translocation and assembly module TamA
MDVVTGVRPGLVCAVALAVAATAACGGGAQRRKPVAAGETGVGEVVITGTKAIDPDDLLDGLGVIRARALGQPFARYLIALDRQRIESYYQRRGFWSTTVESTVAQRGTLRDITFAVVEGPRSRLVSVDVVGLPDGMTYDDLRSKIPLAEGAPFDYEAYELAKPALIAVLEEEGYAHARIEPTVLADREHNATTIRLEVDPGPRARFGDINVTGVDGELASTVRKRLHIKPGDPYSLSELADSRADLYELGRFSLVRLETDKSGRGPIVPVEVKIGMRPRNELRLGGGVGYSPISYEARARSSYGITGWPAPLWNTLFELRPAVVKLKDEDTYEPRIEATTSLERIDLFRPRLNGSITGSFSYLALEAYTSYGPRLHLGLRSTFFHRKLSGSVGWKIQQMRFRNIDAALDMMTIDRLRLDEPERVAAFDQSVILDLRDSPLAPTRGFYAALRTEEGAAATGSAFDYIRIEPEARAYYTFAATTLALRAGLGVMHGDLPTTLRFFGGGASSQRGFGERRLAPMAVADVDGETRRVPYGGGAIALGGVELRRHITTVRKEITIGLVGFLDAADVTEQLADIDVSNLHWAAGGGVRVKYVVPVRFDIGYRLNRVGPMDPDPASSTWDRLAFHLSVGEAY